MKRKIVSIVLCMLMCATVFAVAQPETKNDASDSSTNYTPTIEPLSAGNILIDLPVGTTVADTQCLGGDWDGTNFWVTGGASGVDPNKIYKLSITGTLLNTYSQPAAATGWGFRDLAFDGTLLYSGCEAGLWSIDPATGTCTLKFSSIAPMACIRALTWVPTENMFYSGNFGNSFYKFPPSGTPITAVTNPGLTAVYGMAYDPVNDSIWIFDQTGTPQTTIFEYNYHTQALTGKSFVVPLLTGSTAQIAGGLFYASDCVSGKAVLGGVTQGTPDDRLFVMELGEVVTNNPPATPGAPTGPSSGVSGVSYSFDATTTDPDGDNISFMFDWGDGNLSSWIGPVASGGIVTTSYAWASAGTYDVKVKAKDTIGAESGWSPAHSIVISAGPTIDIGDITGGLLKIKAVIKNTGSGAATNISWKIELTGGLILLGKSSTGTIATIAAGGESTVTSKLILGFGKTVVKVTADTATKSVNATVLLVFIKI